MEELRREVFSLREVVLQQNKDIVRLKRLERAPNSATEATDLKRLAQIELEMSEQKKSTARITKLCLAAIKALERLEDKPLVLGPEISPDPNLGASAETSSQAVDPVVLKTLCGEIEKLTGMLVKVDEDIDTLDERTEENRTDLDLLMEKMKVLDELNSRLTPDNLRREVDARILIKDLVTKTDLSRGLKTIPFGLSRDDVSQMIDLATSNFLRTVQAETRSWEEKMLDSEQLFNKEIHKLQTRMDENEKTKNLMNSLQERTENKLKEMNRVFETITGKSGLESRVQEMTGKFKDLGGRVDEIRGKYGEVDVRVDMLTGKVDEIGGRVDRMDGKVKDVGGRVDKLDGKVQQVGGKMDKLESKAEKTGSGGDLQSRLKKVEESTLSTQNQLKDLKEDSRLIEETRLTGRMERLGKEISVLKTKQTEVSTALEDLGTKQTSAEEEKRKLEQVLNQYQRSNQKISAFEATLDQLANKVESDGNQQQNILEQLNSKMDKTEVDDLKTGMEKERCKIHYFQDKISNIAKSVDAMKVENNSMRDRFCADIEGQEKGLQGLKESLEAQEKVVKENTQALKDITKESIGKIKEVSANSTQIEKNIRSIKDKSVLFDNGLKELKDQISQLQYSQDQDHRTLKGEISTLQSDKTKSLNLTGEDLVRLKEAVKSLENDLKNMIQDKKTKDFEDEERRLSVEGSLLDLRNYVETMLYQTNSQLGGIATEVDAAQDKISKCVLDLEEMLEKSEHQMGECNLSLDTKLKEVREYVEAKQLDSVERLLGLRKEFVEKHSDYLEMSSNNSKQIGAIEEQVYELRTDKMEKTSLELADLKIETSEKLDRLEKSLDDSARRNSGRFVTLEGRLTGLDSELTLSKRETEQTLESLASSLENTKVETKAVEARQRAESERLNGVVDRLNAQEKDGTSRWKEIKDRQAKVANDVDNIGKQTEAVRKELELRMENNRRNLVELIGSTEIKLSELEDRLKVADLALDNLRVTENNHSINFENKIENLKYKVENFTADTAKIKNNLSDETKESLIELRNSLDQMKAELSNCNMEGFKNIVHSTNETQNKLIASMQKNVDSVLKNGLKMDGLVSELNGTMSSLCSRMDESEASQTEAIKKEHTVIEKVEERVQNIQLNIREIHEKLNKRVEGEEVIRVKQSLEEIGSELRRTIQNNSSKVSELEDLLGCEVRNMKVSLTSSDQRLQDMFNKEFTEVKQSIQERSSMADRRISDLVDNIENHSNLLETVQTTLSNINHNLTTAHSRADLMDARLKSVSEMANVNLEKFATITALEELRVALEGGSSPSGSIKDLERKLDTVAALNKSLDMLVNDLKIKQDTHQVEMKSVAAQAERLNEVVSLSEDVKSLQSKMNQQKAKIIDVEANVNFQERTLDKLGEDVKKINGSVFGNISSVEDRLNKLDDNTADLSLKVNSVSKRTEDLLKEFDSVSSGSARLESKLSLIDSKVGQPEIEKLQSLVTEEVNKLKKEQKEIHTSLQTMINNSKADIDSLKNTSRAEIESLRESSRLDLSAAKNQCNTSASSVTERFQDLQTKLFSHQEESTSQSERINSALNTIKTQIDSIRAKDRESATEVEKRGENTESVQLQNSISSLEKGLRKLEEELRRKLSSHQESQLSLIEKQRRNWEGTREKAEQMSQIFDSLIITNDRPYVSCGLDAAISGPGTVIFNQFELINKIEWENEDGFCLMEPGVYLLQISGTLSNCSAVVKLVSDHLEADLVTLSASASASFKSKSTIFTVEDDDRDAEKIVVDVQEKDGSGAPGSGKVESDFSLLMYKISEVSNSESGGDVWRPVDM